jgi:hypothetical protein
MTRTTTRLRTPGSHTRFNEARNPRGVVSVGDIAFESMLSSDHTGLKNVHGDSRHGPVGFV